MKQARQLSLYRQDIVNFGCSGALLMESVRYFHNKEVQSSLSQSLELVDTWFRASAKTLHRLIGEILPISTIRRHISKLVEVGALRSSRRNKSTCDATKSYIPNSPLNSDKKYYVLDSDVAAYGVDRAIVLNVIRYWCNDAKNNEKQDNFQNGHFWFYSTAEELNKAIGLWSVNKTRKILSYLRKHGVITTDKFNGSSWITTLWYRLTDAERLTVDKSNSDVDKSNDTISQNEKSMISQNEKSMISQNEKSLICNKISNISTEISNVFKGVDKKDLQRDHACSPGPIACIKKLFTRNYSIEFEAFWQHYGKKGSKSKAFDIWDSMTYQDRVQARDSIEPYKRSVSSAAYMAYTDKYLVERVWEYEFVSLNDKWS